MKKAGCLLLVMLIMVSSAHFAYASAYDGEAVVARAEAELGKPYEWGRVGPGSYDACGLVSYCVTGVHAMLGATYTFLNWPHVSNPQPGDICVSSGHCGIYVGAGQMIHAPGEGRVVSYGPVQSGMIYVRPDIYFPPNTGDRVPVIPLALCMAASAGIFLLLIRRKKA